MSGSAPTPNEAVLLLLAEAESASSRQIGERLAMPERSVRRRLARMIRDGYVFSPERGRYRLTAAGAAVMAPRPQLDREEVASGLARFLRTRR
jgi:Mn-dependent DtxR family transcriptional regulator